jgi:DNA primase
VPTPSGPDFREIYGGYVAGLRQGSGSNLTGFCPIHGEIPGKSTPSFSVNVETGLWNCFAGCGGGNLTTFLKAVGEDRTKSARIVERSRQAVQPRVKKKQVGPVFLPEKLLGVFDWCPSDLLADGFEERVLFENDVGYDRELNRVTYPIRDRMGRLVGIVGRQSVPGFGKYKVYTTELRRYGIEVDTFHKGDHLWRADKVFKDLRHSREPVYVVEGFKAALWFCQAGLTNVVALMGSHMTEAQQKMIEVMSPRVVLCLDNDRAGMKGMVDMSQKLQAVQVYVAALPEGIHQPDDLLEEELRDLCGTPINISEARRRWQQHETSP